MGISGMLVRWPFGEVLCEAYPSIHDSLQMTGSYIVLLICLNKVYSLRYPVHYTHYKQSIARTTPWFVLCLAVLPYLVFEPAVLVFRHHHNYTTAAYSPDLMSCVENTWSPEEEDLGFLLFNIFKLICLFILPYVLTILAYLCMVILTHQASANKPKPNPVKLSASFIRMDKNSVTPVERPDIVTMELPDYNTTTLHQDVLWDKAERGTAWILSMIVLVYILSLVPKVILLFHHVIMPDRVLKGRVFYNIVQYAGVIANPILYTMQYTAIKDQLQKIGHKNIY